jgi:hypothetical protein
MERRRRESNQGIHGHRPAYTPLKSKSTSDQMHFAFCEMKDANAGMAWGSGYSTLPSDNQNLDAKGGCRGLRLSHSVSHHQIARFHPAYTPQGQPAAHNRLKRPGTATRASSRRKAFSFHDHHQLTAAVDLHERRLLITRHASIQHRQPVYRLPPSCRAPTYLTTG